MTALAAPPSCPPRFATARTPSRPTLGGAAAKIAARLGSPLMPWQRYVADVALELDPVTRRLIYREVDLTVPRQQGKTTLLLAIVLTRALGAPGQSIRFTSQTASDARKKVLDEWRPNLEVSDFAPLFRASMVNGRERFVFTNGSYLGLVATTRKSGHGSVVDLGILDEAFAHSDARLEQALKPAMLTRPSPQLWVVSTAGTRALSPYLWGKVERGRDLAVGGVRTGVCYFEWGAPDDADPADPETWRAAMPALGRLFAEDAIAADFASMDLPEFRRAFLNQWTSTSAASVIALPDWDGLADPSSEMRGRVVFAVDTTPEASASSIAVAGFRRDGRAHVEIVERAEGRTWLPARLAELAAKYHPIAVVVDPAGPSGSLLAEIQKRRVRVETVTAPEYADAFAMFVDAVADGQVRHLGTQELRESVDGSSRRPLGDRWAWARKTTAVDVSPLVAATLAYWGLRTKKRPEYIVDPGELWTKEEWAADPVLALRGPYPGDDDLGFKWDDDPETEGASSWRS